MVSTQLEGIYALAACCAVYPLRAPVLVAEVHEGAEADAKHDEHCGNHPPLELSVPRNPFAFIRLDGGEPVRTHTG